MGRSCRLSSTDGLPTKAIYTREGAFTPPLFLQSEARFSGAGFTHSGDLGPVPSVSFKTKCLFYKYGLPTGFLVGSGRLLTQPAVTIS